MLIIDYQVYRALALVEWGLYEKADATFQPHINRARMKFHPIQHQRDNRRGGDKKQGLHKPHQHRDRKIIGAHALAKIFTRQF